MENGKLITTSLGCKNTDQSNYTRGVVKKQYKL